MWKLFVWQQGVLVQIEIAKGNQAARQACFFKTCFVTSFIQTPMHSKIISMLCFGGKIRFVPDVDGALVAVCRVLLLYLQPGEAHEGVVLHWTEPQLPTLRYAALGLLHSMAPCFPQVSPFHD